jgi:hypothetical protein
MLLRKSGISGLNSHLTNGGEHIHRASYFSNCLALDAKSTSRLTCQGAWQGLGPWAPHFDTRSLSPLGQQAEDYRAAEKKFCGRGWIYLDRRLRRAGGKASVWENDSGGWEDDMRRGRGYQAAVVEAWYCVFLMCARCTFLVSINLSVTGRRRGPHYVSARDEALFDFHSIPPHSQRSLV